MTSLSETPLFPRQDAAAAVTQWLPQQRSAGTAPTALPAQATSDAARAEGYADGRRAAAADIEELQRRLATGAVLLEAAAVALHRRAAESLEIDADQIAELAYGLVEALLERELSTSSDAWRAAVQRALRRVEPTHDVTIRLHPADAATITEDQLAELREDDSVVSVTGRIRLMPDSSVEVGGCVADVGHGRIDAQVGPALHRVAAALGVTGPADRDDVGEATQ